MKHQSYNVEIKRQQENAKSSIRKSNRQSMVHKSMKDARKYNICNEEIFTKSLLVLLQNISLKNNNEKDICGPNITSSFTADVSYYKELCYRSFKTPWWKKIKLTKNESNSHFAEQLSPLEESCYLIQHLLIDKKEICTITQLRHFYEQITSNQKYPNLRSVDFNPIHHGCF